MGGHYAHSSPGETRLMQVVTGAEAAPRPPPDELGRGLGGHCRRRSLLLPADNKSAINDNSSRREAADQWPFVAPPPPLAESASFGAAMMPERRDCAAEAAAAATGRRLRWSVQVVDENDETNGGRQTTTRGLRTAALWPAATIGRCSTFAAADVRRAIRVGITRQREQQRQLQLQRRLTRWCKLVAPADRADGNGKLPSVKFKCNPSIVGRRLQLDGASERDGSLSGAENDEQQARARDDLDVGRRRLDCMQRLERRVGRLNSSAAADRAGEQDKSELILSTRSVVGAARDEEEQPEHNSKRRPSSSGKNSAQTIRDQEHQTSASKSQASAPLRAAVSMHSVQSLHHATHSAISMSLHSAQELAAQSSSAEALKKQQLLNGNNTHHSIVSLASLSSSNGTKSSAQPINLIGGAGSSGSIASINQSAAAAAANQSAANKLGRLVGKKASRVKELLLQNLGRAERTTDELFDLYEENFLKQQHQAQRMSKEFKSYAQSLRQFHDSSRSLGGFLKQSGGVDVTARHDLICDNLSQLELLNEDLLEKMRDQILANMENYLDQFGELKEKIAKRHRKLTDFDSSKRAFNVMLGQVNKRRIRAQQQQQTLGGVDQATSASQLVDEARLLKMREQFNYCRLMYETINSELHDELPVVYEKKMKILWTMLRNYFALEARYHSQAAKLMATASDVIDESPEMLQIAADSSGLVGKCRQQQQQKYSDSDAIVSGSGAGQTQVNTDGGQTSGDESGASGHKSARVGGGSSSGVGSSRGDSSCLDTSSSSSSSPDMRPQAENQADDEDDEQQQQADEQQSGKELEPVDLEAEAGRREGPASQEEESAGEKESVGAVGESVAGGQATQPEQEEASEARVAGEESAVPLEIQQIVTSKHDHAEDDDHEHEKSDVDCSQLIGRQQPKQSNKVGDKEDVCLYKVKTNYKYLAEDVDELCFEADEVIQVIEFDESHEPEDGWLMGVREVNGQRGLFPANFTRPI